VPAVLFLGLTVLVIGFEVASSLRHRRQAMRNRKITPME
jgi:hypothetical protein